MYDQFYGLSGRPFQLTPDPAFYFESGTHRKAMSYLGYGLAQGEGFIVITGDIGAGKTTLVGHLMNTIDPNRLTAVKLVSTAVEGDDLLRMVAEQFELDWEGLGKAELLRNLEQFLREQARAGRRTLLIVDEGQNLSVNALEELRMLSNFQLGGHSLLQIFLLGQPEFRHTLFQTPSLEQLRQRVIATHHLDPMEPEEVEPYILHRLGKVNWAGNPSFSPDAFEALFDHSDGVPRKLNVLVSRLLLFGAVEQLTRITAQHVRAVVAEMQADGGMGEQPPAPAPQEVPVAAPAALAPAAPLAPAAAVPPVAPVAEPAPFAAAPEMPAAFAAPSAAPFAPAAAPFAPTPFEMTPPPPVADLSQMGGASAPFAPAPAAPAAAPALDLGGWGEPAAVEAATPAQSAAPFGAPAPFAAPAAVPAAAPFAASAEPVASPFAAPSEPVAASAAPLSASAPFASLSPFHAVDDVEPLPPPRGAASLVEARSLLAEHLTAAPEAPAAAPFAAPAQPVSVAELDLGPTGMEAAFSNDLLGSYTAPAAAVGNDMAANSAPFGAPVAAGEPAPAMVAQPFVPPVEHPFAAAPTPEAAPLAPMDVKAQGEDMVALQRQIAGLEARIADQDAALRRVLDLLIDWVERDPAGAPAVKDWAA